MVDYPSRVTRLRTLLVLIVMIAVTPVFALQLARLQSSREAALGEAHTQAFRIANSGAEAHVEGVQQARNLLEILREMPSVRNATADCGRILAGISGMTPWIKVMAVTDADGRAWCRNRPEDTKPLSLGSREYFQRAMRTGEFVVSDVLIGQVTGETTIVMALPMFDAQGKPNGVIATSVDLIWLNQVAAAASERFKGIVLTLDRSGNTMLERPENAIPTRNPSERGLVQSILTAKTNTLELLDTAGERRIFGIARMPELGTTIAVGLRREDVLEPVNRAFHADLLLLLFVAASSIAASMIVAEFAVLRGVRVLKVAAQRLKAGKIGLRVQLPSFVAGELHSLAATYNAMTAEFERLAYLDRLTGLPNRRFLERQVTLRKPESSPPTEAVLAIDLDGFKPVNDTHGHAVGDKVLAAVARRIASVVDERGLLARLGGDEFVVVLPLAHATDREPARVLAEEICRALDRDPIELDGARFAVGCSIGIALVPQDAGSLSEAIAVADAALYAAKRSGRNRVVDNAPSIAFDRPTSEAESDWPRLERVARRSR